MKLFKYKTTALIIAISFLYSPGMAAGKKLTPPEIKRIELKKLEETAAAAAGRIRNSDNTRARDYLKLLPTVSLSRRSPTEDIPGSETYLSASINTNQIFDIADRQAERESLKRRAARQIQSLKYKITKLILKKYLINDRIWKYRLIKRSLENPVEIAGMDEKITSSLIKREEVETDIEKAYAEIEFICVEIEK